MKIWLRSVSAVATLALAAATAWAEGVHAQPNAASTPETVMVTVQAKPGAEAALASVIARHWRTVRQLDLVSESPHLSLRGTDGGGTYFVEIFTWRDRNIPEDAPAQVQAIWAEMNVLAESRGGALAIAIAPVAIVAPN
jgi:hypothetical protein